MRTPTTLRRLAGALAVSGLLVTGLGATPSLASGGDHTGDRAPIFDFSDAYYRANGVDPAGLVGRRNGADGISVVDRAPDATTATSARCSRSRRTTPAASAGSSPCSPTSRPARSPPTPPAATPRRWPRPRPVYVFPTLTGDPTGVGNNRQADMIDLSHGYFSNNPLGLWVHVFVTWTPKALTTKAGTKALADLKARNGESLDGTPIIKTQSDLDALAAKGYVKLTKRGTDQQGRYFVCPVFKDPRRGAITADAILATVRRADGTALPAEQGFVDDFNALKATGEYPLSLSRVRCLRCGWSRHGRFRPRRLGRTACSTTIVHR